MRILVTAGPTREFFDSVRFISNPSSGKMGYAIAAEAARRGHEVALVSGPVELPDPEGVEVVRVVTAQEMFQVATSLFEHCEAAVMTAAVCDYRPARTIDHKLKKRNRIRPIQLMPTRDICAHLGRVKEDRVVVGFAMEDHDHHRNAEAKLTRKRCDAIVLNGIGNVAGDSAEIEILRADTGWSGPYAGTKSMVATVVMDLVEELVGVTE
jgi:phosphopantothenoylcysteine decarboxylase/phosphopantothenate--cysteine ligase